MDNLFISTLTGPHAASLWFPGKEAGGQTKTSYLVRQQVPSPRMWDRRRRPLQPRQPPSAPAVPLADHRAAPALSPPAAAAAVVGPVFAVVPSAAPAVGAAVADPAGLVFADSLVLGAAAPDFAVRSSLHFASRCRHRRRRPPRTQ